MTEGRLVPASHWQAEIEVQHSRFLADVSPAYSVEEARSFISKIKSKYSDATHHVPAFIIGHGNSVITHCSDDGEPSGTAGRPALSVLQGSGLGDVVVVVTRYFGGTKLGKGGLVRAYSDAVRSVLEALPRAVKISTYSVSVVAPYSYYDRLKLLVSKHAGSVLSENFGVEVSFELQFTIQKFAAFQSELREMTNGTLGAEIIEENPDTIIPLVDL